MQMYFVVHKGDYSADVSRQVQLAVRGYGGLILMVMRNGVIVALEESDAERLKGHHLVSDVHPVTLHPRGIAAESLQRIFAENLRKQLDPNLVEPPSE